MFLSLRVRNPLEVARNRGSGREILWKLRNGASFCIQMGSSDTLAAREVILSNIYPVSRKHYDLVVDIGAHVGTFTARICSRANRVVAFEPTARNFSMLQKFCKSPLNNIEFHNLAITGDGRKVKINLHPENTGQHSIFNHAVPASGVEEVCSVSSNDLLEFLQADRIDLLKIDVEGAEHEICLAAVNVLKKTREVIIEINTVDADRTPDSLAVFLEDIGFRLRRVSGDEKQSIFFGINTDAG